MFRPGRSYEIYIQESRMSLLNRSDATKHLTTMPTKVNHLHDFVRETSITTEEWMFAYVSPSPSILVAHFCDIGRQSIF